MTNNIKISDFDYLLPEQRIAKFPLHRRDESKLLIYRNGNISHRLFSDLPEIITNDTLLVFNNTRVVRARIVMHKQSGARIEIFCLEPHYPADYERAFSVKGKCSWCCMVGNLKKWKEGALTVNFDHNGKQHSLKAYRGQEHSVVEASHIIYFEWDADITFGQMLELLGRIPIPPYLNRDSQELDNRRYQTVYALLDGSVAAPTAGLHFSQDMIHEMQRRGVAMQSVTLHVGAGTFLPVKSENAADHNMHTEHFEISRAGLENIIAHHGCVTAVGTTTVRTLESLAGLGYRIERGGDPQVEEPVGQWELYDIPSDYDGVRLLDSLLRYMQNHNMDRIKASTRIMITPAGFRFRIVNMLITNFHQPKSTLLLLVSAFTDNNWRHIYDYAMDNDFRFLSYGDSSLLWLDKIKRYSYRTGTFCKKCHKNFIELRCNSGFCSRL